jgi:hypothetical protein
MVVDGPARTRTSRVHLSIEVFVYGYKEGGTPFKEITQTITINANGCLLGLTTPVVKEQQLFLTNLKSEEEVSCYVVSVGNPEDGKLQVAIRFENPSPRFWGLTFPPDDWDPANRKRPAPTPQKGSK